MPVASSAPILYGPGASPAGGATTLAALTDVGLTAPVTANQVLRWDAASGKWVNATPANTQMYELGGSAGNLAVNDGLGVATPVAGGWTLLANQLHGRVTTAPVGSPVTIQVRLMPGATVVSTGTIAAGATQATWTAFTDRVFTDGQWIEVVVTAVGSTTPGAELTVMGEIAGP